VWYWLKIGKIGVFVICLVGLIFTVSIILTWTATDNFNQKQSAIDLKVLSASFNDTNANFTISSNQNMTVSLTLETKVIIPNKNYTQTTLLTIGNNDVSIVVNPTNFNLNDYRLVYLIEIDGQWHDGILLK